MELKLEKCLELPRLVVHRKSLHMKRQGRLEIWNEKLTKLAERAKRT
jgi:hypothetical protein